MTTRNLEPEQWRLVSGRRRQLLKKKKLDVIKGAIFGKTLLNQNLCFGFLYKFCLSLQVLSETFLHSKKN